MALFFYIHTPSRLHSLDCLQFQGGSQDFYGPCSLCICHVVPIAWNCLSLSPITPTHPLDLSLDTAGSKKALPLWIWAKEPPLQLPGVCTSHHHTLTLCGHFLIVCPNCFVPWEILVRNAVLCVAGFPDLAWWLTVMLSWSVTNYELL